MVITISAIGKIKEKWMKEGIDEYLKRLKPFAKMNIIEHEEEKFSKKSEEIKKQVMEKESIKLLKSLKDTDCCILLDTSGKEMSSEELASWFENKMISGKSRFNFFIGGPLGNGETIRKNIKFKLCLSKMTLTHQMARLILVEQIYRSIKIIKNEPYHL